MNNQITETKVERKSDRELTVSGLVQAQATAVFEAWRNPELFQKWWLPESAPIKLLSCEMDVRTGGSYRLVFAAGAHHLAFFGTYVEVLPSTRLVWTNDEGGKEASTLTTVTFEEANGATKMFVHELYPSKEALDEALASESTGAWPEQFNQLERLLAQ